MGNIEGVIVRHDYWIGYDDQTIYMYTYIHVLSF